MTRHRLASWKFLPLLVLVIMAAAGLAWWRMGNELPVVPLKAIEVEEVGGKSAVPKSSPPKELPSPKVAEQSPAISDVLTPEEVIGNPECFLETGHGNAEGFAAVAVPEHDGFRLAVLDGAGTVFDGVLPFPPDFSQIGKRRDGSVVVGFGDLKYERGEGSGAPRPVRVYRDGSIIFESAKARRLGVAPDGSSFFVVEPLANGVSNLRVHNLDLGIEKHYELDQIGSHENPEPPYLAKYTTPPTEVHFVHQDVYESQWFYPTDGGPPRSLKMDYDVASLGVFASSRFGYFARQGRDRAEEVIFKREFHHDGIGEPTSIELWSRTLDLDGFSDMRLSDDGAWLMVGALNLHVLDAETGEAVFAFPTEVNLSRLVDPDVPQDWSSKHKYKIQYGMYREAQFERLATVLPDDATVDNVGGHNFGFMQIRGGLLMMSRGSYRRTGWDIYDMSEIQLDSQPKARIKTDIDIKCTSGNVPGLGLQEVDDKLTYLTERLTLDAN